MASIIMLNLALSRGFNYSAKPYMVMHTVPSVKTVLQELHGAPLYRPTMMSTLYPAWSQYDYTESYQSIIINSSEDVFMQLIP